MLIKFSFIITLYNRRLLSVRAIESVLRLSFMKELASEIIIIDDGSTDDPLEVINPLIANNDIIKYYFKENGGPASAKNYGAKKAKGEYIFFLDSDDYLENENSFNGLKDLLNKSPDLIAGSSMIVKKGNSQHIVKASPQKNIYDYCLEYPLNYVGFPPYVFDRIRFLKVGGFNNNHKWGDALSFWRLYIKNANVVYYDEPCYVYDQSSEHSVSRSRGTGFYKKVLKTISDSYEISKNEIDSKGYSFNWGVIILVLSAATLNRKLFFNWFFRCLLAPVKTVKSIIYVFKKRREKE